jgi:hypothetical protein
VSESVVGKPPFDVECPECGAEVGSEHIKKTYVEEAKEFIVNVPVHWSLNKLIRARNREEAERIAEGLEPDEFENFHGFYEFLGDEWSELKDRMEIIELNKRKRE